MLTLFQIGESTVDVIKNGAVWQTIAPMVPEYERTLVDKVTEDGYYRIEVTAFDGTNYTFAWSNPVFVKVPKS